MRKFHFFPWKKSPGPLQNKEYPTVLGWYLGLSQFFHRACPSKEAEAPLHYMLVKAFDGDVCR